MTVSIRGSRYLNYSMKCGTAHLAEGLNRKPSGGSLFCHSKRGTNQAASVFVHGGANERLSSAWHIRVWLHTQGPDLVWAAVFSYSTRYLCNGDTIQTSAIT